MDSLRATRLRAALNGAVRRAGVPASVPRNVVYAYPTCAALARFLMGFVNVAAGGPAAAERRAADDLEVEIAEMVERYSKDLPRHQGRCALGPADGEVYAVTGTTGSLGAAFVALLLAQPHVKKVYALNRRHGSQSIASRQEAAFVDKGLDLSLLRDAIRGGRVEFVEFEAGKHRLGINGEVYSKVRCLTLKLPLLLFGRITATRSVDEGGDAHRAHRMAAQLQPPPPTLRAPRRRCPFCT